MPQFLDYDGLVTFWEQLRERFVGVESGKGLSTNDFTNLLKEKLENNTEIIFVTKEEYMQIEDRGTNGKLYYITDLTIKEDVLIDDMEASSESTYSSNKINSLLNDCAKNTDIDDIQTEIDSKVDKENGKGLSTNDFTADYKNQLDRIDNFDGSYDSLTNKPIVDFIVTETSDNAVKSSGIYDYVNSSVSTNTAYFRGTFNSVAELNVYTGDKTLNDYAFVKTTDSAGNTLYNRYKWNNTSWVFEYSLNNSSFTANQWSTINSGLTSNDKTEIAKIFSIETQIADMQTEISDLQTSVGNVLTILESVVEV